MIVVLSFEGSSSVRAGARPIGFAGAGEPVTLDLERDLLTAVVVRSARELGGAIVAALDGIVVGIFGSI